MEAKIVVTASDLRDRFSDMEVAALELWWDREPNTPWSFMSFMILDEGRIRVWPRPFGCGVASNEPEDVDVTTPPPLPDWFLSDALQK